MIIATIAIAVLLGSASVAQAGRKCIACALPEDLEDLSREEKSLKRFICAAEDLSKYVSKYPTLSAQMKKHYGISIKDCGDDPCFTSRDEYFSRAWHHGNAGRPKPKGTRGCFTPEIRAGLRSEVPATNSPAACRNIVNEAEGSFLESCFEVCDTDRCNAKLHRSRTARANRDASAARANRDASAARANRDASAARANRDASADASIEKQKARNSA